jgi:hypothetical protein
VTPRRIAIAVAVLAIVASHADAEPVADYRARLERVMDKVGTMYDDADDGSVASADALEQARALLPPKETVELGSASIEVDNTWFGEQIDAYKATTDPGKRETMLEQISTRLAAADAHLNALDSAPQHATPEERAKLEEILSRAEFQSPAESPFTKTVRELRDRVLKFLSDLIERLFGGARGQSFAVGMRIVIIAAGSLALLLLVRAVAIALARRGVGGKRKKAAKHKKTKTVLGEEVDESTTATDIEAAARALASRGDYRGAIRKLFVALIYQLDERGLVRLHAEATNREYLALVRGLGTLHPVMTSMTDVFERVWYGEVPVGRTEYDAFESMYTRAAEIVTQASVVRSA